MRKNAKGFTLIELLAVIVILAIIALITVPTVLNIIDNAKMGAAKDSAYSVIKGAEYHYMEQLYAGASFAGTTCTYGTVEGEEVDCDTVIEIKGTKPTAGTINIAANGTVTITEDLVINNFTLEYANDTFTIDGQS